MEGIIEKEKGALGESRQAHLQYMCSDSCLSAFKQFTKTSRKAPSFMTGI
jgi:hypothetical protein